MTREPLTFWEHAAVSIACAIVRNAGAAGLHLDSVVIARAAAEVADKLEEERRKREAKPS